jgi:hypothetical protein
MLSGFEILSSRPEKLPRDKPPNCIKKCRPQPCIHAASSYDTWSGDATARELPEAVSDGRAERGPRLPRLPYNDGMSDRLRLVFEAASKLPAKDQEALAAIIEEELADERRWRAHFTETPDVLRHIAERAKRQYGRGEFGDL